MAYCTTFVLKETDVVARDLAAVALRWDPVKVKQARLEGTQHVIVEVRGRDDQAGPVAYHHITARAVYVVDGAAYEVGNLPWLLPRIETSVMTVAQKNLVRAELQQLSPRAWNMSPDAFRSALN